MSMTKEEKKARKLIKKLEKKREKKAAEESWAKYEPAGCHKCSAGQLFSGGACELSVTYYSRCKCANIKTKKYKEFKKNKGNLSHKEYKKIKKKFYDNNSHIDVGNNADGRSW